MSGATRPIALGAAALALTLGCTPDTVTPLLATDGEPPARDLARALDESVQQPDSAPDRGPADAACTDGGDGATDGACGRDGTSDTVRDMRAD